MRLDAHQFFTPEHVPEHLHPILERNRFSGSIAVASTVEETRKLLALATRFTFIRGVIGSNDFDDPRILDEYEASPVLLGWTAPPQFPASQLAGTHLPIDLKMPAAAAVEWAERHPGLRIALVHLGLPDGSRAWFEAIEHLAEMPHVYCKASGLLALARKDGAPWNAAVVRPYVQHALSTFGVDRVMFGSDWPSCLPENIWKETLAVFTQSIGAQSMEVREKLLGDNAARFYGVGVL